MTPEDHMLDKLQSDIDNLNAFIKVGVLSAILSPVGRRSFRSRKIDVFFIHSNYA